MTDNNENKVLNVPHLRFPNLVESGKYVKCLSYWISIQPIL